MQHVRRPARGRLFAVAALTLCAGFAVAGCRSQVGAAAYVGDQTLTEREVDEIVDDATGKVTGELRAPTRVDVVTTFILAETCAATREQKSFPLVPVPNLAQSEGIPADSTYAKQRADMIACVEGFTESTASSQDTKPPTDEELRDIYDRALAGGIPLEDVTFDQVAAQLRSDTTVQQYEAFRRLLAGMVEKGDVSVSPRYRPLELPLHNLGTEVPLIVVPLGEPGSDAVRDL